MIYRSLGIEGIPKLITSNINDQSDIESDNEPWIIMEHINGVTLNEFVKPKSISFRDKSILTIKLLNIVREMHRRNIVHRHIKLDSIIIKTQSDTENRQNLRYSDQINLFLIDFSQACFIQNNEYNQTMIFQDALDHIQNNFYQVLQLERQPSTDDENENQQDKSMLYSPTIDTSSVCAVLFWLITDEYPRGSRDIHGNAPHQRGKFIDIINEQLKKATGKFLLGEIHHYFVCIGVWTESERGVPLKQHLQKIFDRGFASPDKQWPIEELNYELQHILRLATRNNEENNCFPPPVSKKQMKSSLNTSKPEYFLQLASTIDLMKRQFSIRYPDMHWSTDNQSRWSQNDQQVRNRDFVIFEKQQRSIVIETLCCAEINKNQELVMEIKARNNQRNEVTLSLGVWKQYEQEDIKEEIFKIFELELKILIDIFYKEKFM
jgi:serine/threonine protein kinase